MPEAHSFLLIATRLDQYPGHKFLTQTCPCAWPSVTSWRRRLPPRIILLKFALRPFVPWLTAFVIHLTYTTVLLRYHISDFQYIVLLGFTLLARFVAYVCGWLRRFRKPYHCRNVGKCQSTPRDIPEERRPQFVMTLNNGRGIFLRR